MGARHPALLHSDPFENDIREGIRLDIEPSWNVSDKFRSPIERSSLNCFVSGGKICKCCGESPDGAENIDAKTCQILVLLVFDLVESLTSSLDITL